MPPHSDRLLSGRDAVWRIVAVLAFRCRVALQRVVGQRVTDEEFEEEFHVLFAVENEFQMLNMLDVWWTKQAKRFAAEEYERRLKLSK